MTAPGGFSISEVRFRGHDVEDAFVSFALGLAVVAGPSNTGKSLIRSAINFVFGSSQPMKAVIEAAPYRSIFVEIRTGDGSPVTFERAWRGGDIRQYQVPAGEISDETPSVVLSARHAADNEASISRVLLAMSGLDGVRLRKNQKGETRSLSFRDLPEYVLVSEERIITELSPIHSSNVIEKTAESSLFRMLITGKDDKDIAVAPSNVELKAQTVGREAILERLRLDLSSRIEKIGQSEEELLTAAETLDKRIDEQSRLLLSFRADFSGLERRRRELSEEMEKARARLSQIEGNLARFQLLSRTYESDMHRLRSNLGAGMLFADLKEGPCPICGADPEHHKHDVLFSQQDLDAFTAACSAEAEKIQLRQADLAATISQLQDQAGDLRGALVQIDGERQKTIQALRAVVEPNIAGLDEGLAGLVSQRRDIERALAVFEECRHVDEIEKSLEPAAPAPRSSPKQEFAGIPPHAYDDLAKAVESILRAWSFPELDRVFFDTTFEDIVISGKARKDNGKGYRAITYAAFVISMLQETRRRGLPHPGFVVLDSPLVTYREPTENMGERLKFAFYRSLAKSIGTGQVVILENEEPPEDLKEKISYTEFSKNRSAGRYGLFPPLPEQQEE